VLILALVVVVIGGPGSLKGAFAGALLVGMAETFGQVWLPEVVMPCSLEAACGQFEADVKVTASLQPEARSLRAIRQGATGSAALAIGPEGDFTESEYAVLAAAGFQPWSLGSLILRSETAAVCALSILGYELASDPI